MTDHPVQPHAELVTITPEMAVEMLERNIDNRPIRQNRVNLYADEMRRGKWTMTGETMKISIPDANDKVRLLDGQHRLWACVESGVPFQTYIIYNVPNEAMTFIDSGLPRSVGDIIGMAGIDHANHRGTTARLILAWREGIVQNKPKVAAIGRDRILEFVQANYEDQGDAIRIGGQIRRVSSGSHTAIAAFVFEIRRVNPAKAEEFIAKWINGDNLDAESPIRALRHWLIQRTMNRRRTENPQYLLVMTKAWNAFLVNGSIRKMIVRKDEDVPDLNTGISREPIRSSSAPQKEDKG